MLLNELKTHLLNLSQCLLILCVLLIRIEKCSTKSVSTITRHLELDSSNDISNTHHRSQRAAIWPTTNIKWSFNKTGFDFVRSNDINVGNIMNIFSAAFKVWETYTCLTFHQVDNLMDADIEIKFERGNHGDGYNFDGSGTHVDGESYTNVVAHAFYPGYGRGGDIHFDADEKWDFTIYDGHYNGLKEGMKNLKTVAVHEIGHSVGLLDTNVMDSVMFAAYSHPCRLEQLYKYDVENIHRLYGCAMKRTPSPKCPEETIEYDVPEVAPDICNIKYDSITIFRGEIFIFKDQYFWRVNDDGRVIDNNARKIAEMFNGLPHDLTSVDAVYERNFGTKSSGITIFIGGTCYHYDSNNKLTHTSKLSQMGFPQRVHKIDAVMRLQVNGIKQIYAFSGSQYWEIDEIQWRIKPAIRNEISNKWRGIGNRIDGAFQHFNGKIYFFKENRFFEFNYSKKKVVENKPKLSSPQWISNCRKIPEESNESYVKRRVKQTNHVAHHFSHNEMS